MRRRAHVKNQTEILHNYRRLLVAGEGRQPSLVSSASVASGHLPPVIRSLTHPEFFWPC